jgi:hypothetical protein
LTNCSLPSGPVIPGPRIKAAEKAGYACTRGRHKMGGNDELFKTKAQAMLGGMPWPDDGLTGLVGLSP